MAVCEDPVHARSGLPALHAITVEYLEAGLTEFREETTDRRVGTYVRSDTHS